MQITRREYLQIIGSLGVAAAAISLSPSAFAESLLKGISAEDARKLQQQAEEVQRYVVGTTAGPVYAYVMNGRIIRITPLECTEAEQATGYSLNINGQVYQPPAKWPSLPWGTTAKNWIYSPHRLLYPLKRVDFDNTQPGDQRNQANRGKSGYVRISWDDALGILASEITRLKTTYGPGAIAVQNQGHPEWGAIQYMWSWFRFWNLIGYTPFTWGAISWVGWASGTTFEWGFWPSWGQPGGYDTNGDVLQNTDMLVNWGLDPLIQSIYAGSGACTIYSWFKGALKDSVFIDPYYNDTGANYFKRWIPIIPGTDAALAAAIANVWITEGTYDEDYLDSHTVGFDEEHLPSGAPPGSSFKNYIMGVADGIPKTPKWAENITGVPSRTIKALARKWASENTSLTCCSSGACRRDYAEEWTRFMVTLMAMQGVGKPGVNFNVADGGVIGGGPMDFRVVGPPGYALGGIDYLATHPSSNPVLQELSETFAYDAIVLGKSLHWHGSELTYPGGADMFFMEHNYPMTGYSPVHSIWTFGTSNLVGHGRAQLNNWMAICQSPQIELIGVHSPWFESGTRYADLVLPVTTVFERIDVTEAAASGWTPPDYPLLRVSLYHQMPIQPQGEAKTEIEMYTELATKLGIEDQYTEGNTEEDWCKLQFAKAKTVAAAMSYDDFKAKGYFVMPYLKDYVPMPALRPFYNDPVKNPVNTPSGKIEIFSTAIANYYKTAYQPDIPAVPHYIPETEGRSSPLASKYPLQLNNKHPKFRFHGKWDDVTWMAEIYKVKGPDGYLYEPIEMTPADAAARGLKDGDIVRVFNDRGQVLGGVKITNRTIEGVVRMTYGAWPDPLEPTPGAIDRHGNTNFVNDNRGISPSHHQGGPACNSTLVEVEKADLAALQAEYPDGWAGAYSTWVSGAD